MYVCNYFQLFHLIPTDFVGVFQPELGTNPDFPMLKIEGLWIRD